MTDPKIIVIYRAVRKDLFMVRRYCRVMKTILRKENHTLSDSISRSTTENPYFMDKTGTLRAVVTPDGRRAS